MMIIESHILQI